MKKTILSFLFLGLMTFALPLQAQSADAHEKLKKHINEMVEQVQEESDVQQKRVMLNKSLDDLIKAVDRVESNKMVPDSDKKALADFKESLTDRKNELNGTNGYAKVPGNQLNDYANFIQQEMEQADKVVTLSLTTALLIVLILLLL
ncbi:hypothetical protein [Gracilimonas mengyeensis]|uniref:Uncharacterized protein n=1 Tax=Gracilimonas mengyeensis TaxID=1302730 RepID=A0A521C2Z5_9BACT|nr:hypothetical protein [Gracilimonas mengyeensis]SMO53822.1 hypothetical protein SAMN06265219_104107 [Gracilimonas mengyeensis]